MKKIIMYSLLAYTLTQTPIAAQGVWSPRASFPDTGYFQGISGFSIGNYGYAGLGQYHNTFFDDFWQFNTSINSWTQKASFPGSARVSPASFVIGGKGYIVTGSIKNFGACVTECWEYDTTTDTWTQKANFPDSARVYAVGFAIDSLGYVGTGANELSDFRKDFYAYHPSTDTWTRAADFGGIARSAACGFACNGKGYVCFGQDSAIKYYTDMWEFDPISNTWVQKSSYPGPHIYAASGFVIGANIYVGSGDTAGFTFDPQFWKYNTLTDSWSEVMSIPGIGKIQGAAFAVADTGYYGLGADISFNPSNELNKFYPDSSTGIPAMKIERNDIFIYPNPFRNSCIISLPQNENVYSFVLTDMEGRQMDIVTKKLNLYSTIYRGNLKAGIYLLSVVSNKGTYYKKLIITN